MRFNSHLDFALQRFLGICFSALVLQSSNRVTSFPQPDTMDVESLEHYRRRLDGAAISTYVMVMILVPLKLWCRKRSGGWRNLGLDDFITVVSLLFASAFFWLCLIGQFEKHISICWPGAHHLSGMRPYIGKQVTELQIPEVIQFLKLVFWGQILYVWAIPVIKFSILAFYWRLFSVSARIPIWIAFFIVFAWLMALVGG